jgi:ABC-2 type transport system permease protein
MTPRITLAISGRVLRQLRHDPRTVVLLIVVPSLLVVLLRYVFDGRPQAFDTVGPGLVGLFPLISMFLVGSITVLRERTTGTLERLLTMPLHKLDILAGYGLAFAGLAAVQAAVVSIVAFGLLGLDVQGSPWAVGALAVGNALLGMALGLLVSAFAATEFQAVQFMPAFVLPQLLLCGLFVPREQMVGWLQAVSDALPLTYAVDALAQVGRYADPTATMWRDLTIVVGAVIAALILAAATLRRRTP